MLDYFYIFVNATFFDAMTFYACDPKQPGATTRKGAAHADRLSSEISYYADDEDATRKYTRRGELTFKMILVDS